MSSVLEKGTNNIALPEARMLNTKVKRIRQEYIERLEVLFLEHGIYKKLEALTKTADYPVSEEAACALEGITRITSNLMRCLEKKCHKLHTAYYEFSPKVWWWLDRYHAFR